ncbi:MAG TPA: NAD(P)H-dependent oxidoreductase subunit E [Chitinispirillaceae bacterium]|nr:NAD(P)H-dependent oxidoreductase subunit E [Chitinispirillaceae bacterium]
MKFDSTDNWEIIKAESIAVLPRKVVEHIQKTSSLPHSESYLISTLHLLQEVMGFLGIVQLEAVAQLMQIPSAKVVGVASFYHSFRLKQTGRFVISLCMGTACYVKGAVAVADAFTEHLGIKPGETTQDGLFTIEFTRCLGVCSLAPAAMVNTEIHAHLTPEKVPQIIELYRSKIGVEETKSE